MAHQKIEETFRAIDSRQRGSSASAISVGVSSTGDGFSSSLSQAAQEISQLRAVYQSQADLIAANTQALSKSGSPSGGQGSGSSGGGVGSTIESAAQHVLGNGILGFLPLIGGIAKLFGGGSSTPPPLPTYDAPPSISLESTIRNGMASGTTSLADPAQTLQSTDQSRRMDLISPSGIASNASVSGDGSGSEGQTNQSSVGSEITKNTQDNQTMFAPHVTVNVQAMDSQSFLDRSNDIANAVREAVLNLHPLTSVLADL